MLPYPYTHTHFGFFQHQVPKIRIEKQNKYFFLTVIELGPPVSKSLTRITKFNPHYFPTETS